jgi:hypothetical protein
MNSGDCQKRQDGLRCSFYKAQTTDEIVTTTAYCAQAWVSGCPNLKCTNDSSLEDLAQLCAKDCGKDLPATPTDAQANGAKCNSANASVTFTANLNLQIQCLHSCAKKLTKVNGATVVEKACTNIKTAIQGGLKDCNVTNVVCTAQKIPTPPTPNSSAALKISTFLCGLLVLLAMMF